MKIIAVIPARYDSSRFPGKPLAEICGKPMVWWVYQQVKKVTKFSDILIATDDQRIMDVCNELNMNCLMTSVTNETSLDRICEVAMKRKDQCSYMSINGDEPFINPNAIEKVIEEYEKNQSYDVINAMKKIYHKEDITDHTNLKVVTNDLGECVYISRSPIPYPKSAVRFDYYKFVGITLLSPQAIYFYKNTPQGLLESIEECDSIRFLEHQKIMKFIEVSIFEKSISVDTPQDLENANRMMSDLIKKTNGSMSAPK